MGWLLAIVGVIQTVAVVGGFLYTIRAIRQSSDARNVDFIIQAEGQVDPLFVSLMQEAPDTIRRVLPNLIPPTEDDTSVKAYAYSYFAYRHLSRIIYMLGNQAISLGMSKEERQTVLTSWINEIGKYDQEVLRSIHAYSRQTGEFNEKFTEMMDEIYEKPTTEAKSPSGDSPVRR